MKRSNTFNKRLSTGFIAAIMVVAIVTVVAYKTIKSASNADERVAHTHQVIENTLTIISKLSDVEASRDRYLLSGNSKQLDNYYQSVHTIIPDLQDLRTLVMDNPEQVRNVDSLRKYTELKLQHISTPLSASTIAGGNVSDIMAKEVAQDNETLHCKEIGNVIIANEKMLLVTREQTSIEKANTAILIVLSSAIIAITILSFLLVFIWRTFSSLQKLKGQLQISEGIFAGAFRDSGIGMALVSLEGRWMDVNPRLLQLFGYSKEELLLKTFQELTHPEDLDADLALVQRILKGELETYKLEKKYFHKSGYIVWGMLTVSLVRNEDGTPRFFVSQIEDITETKSMIKELELKNKALLQTSAELELKVGQLEEFNRIVAHNLRGPAGGIEMMLNIMTEEKDPKEREEMLRLVSGSSKSLNTTLQNLMQIVEIKLNQDIEYNNCELEEILHTTTQMLQGDILKSKAVIHSKFLVTHVRFPKVYLESLFYNMISNGLKYIKDGVPAMINISSEEENGKTKLIFEDNGIGIDLNRYGQQMFKMNKIFHKGYDSRGVGLFITKNQLETHGGSISVESTPGVGSKFIIYL